MNCPGCGQGMSEQTFERLYARPVAIDICHACAALWFDRLENLTLTPGAVLRLFVVMNDNKPADRHPLPAEMACPRCHARLRLAHDMQRNTRFQYWLCPAEHGHFITFYEFLREKNFIRALSPAELARLKDSVRTVTCRSCGAPIDLNGDAVCPYCRAPLSMIDAAQVDAIVQQLKREEAKRQQAARQPDAVLARLPTTPSDDDAGDDLVRAGLAALSAFLDL
jgi:uncharacterized protein YbaR (Trm112 family)